MGLSLCHRLVLETALKMENVRIKEHPLQQLFRECTLRCNLFCKDCGSDYKKMAVGKNMLVKDFLRTIDIWSIRFQTFPGMYKGECANAWYNRKDTANIEINLKQTYTQSARDKE